jgi:MFS family permease
LIAGFFLPAGVDRKVLPILAGRALRAFADGYIAVLLPAYLLALGFGSLEVGFISTATLIGSALATIAVGAIGHRYSQHRLRAKKGSDSSETMGLVMSRSFNRA